MWNAAIPAHAATSRYVVVYESAGPHRVAPGRAILETDARERALGFAADLRYRHALRGFAAKLTDHDVQQLRRDPEVAEVVPDSIFHALSLVPRAAGEAIPSGIGRIGAASATAAHEPSTATVAVLDSGIDLNHPDLDVQSAINCVTPGPADDNNGHGTMVAGVIGARNQGNGIVGVAPGTKLYSVKVLDSTGAGSLSQIICGVEWVTAHAAQLNVRVANLSLGGPGPNGACTSDPLHLAICNSTAAGVLYTVAAGNDGLDFGANPPETPAAFPEVLTVTAMADSDGAQGAAGPVPFCVPGEHDDFVASFSDFATATADAAHAIAAPGVCILSTAPGGYSVDSGTSIAAPHAAGVASLCLGENGAGGPCAGLTPGQIIQKLRGDAAIHTTGGNGFFGDPLHPIGRFYGNLVSAEQSTIPVPPPPPPSGPSATPAAAPPVQKAPKCKVPKLRGLTAGKARAKLGRAGCRYRLKGRGRVRSTIPAAGKKTTRTVLVRLARHHHKRVHSRRPR